MKLHELKPADGAKKERKRVGRGTGSGYGKTAGRGMKGQNARSGGGVRPGFEGGQNPIIARTPQRGFSNARFRNEYQIINVAALNAFEDGARVDREALATAGLIDPDGPPLKILGNGELTRKLTVAAAKFTAQAAKKITDAGGSTEQE